MPVSPETCDLAALAAEGSEFNGIDKIDALALRVYLMAQIYKENGGLDLTDICALAKTLQQFDSMPDYARQSAQLKILVDMALAAGVAELTEDTVRNAISCAHCCDVTVKSLEAAEMCLFALLGSQRLPN